MKPIINFRVDGGRAIGMGHIVRCLALAEMLKDDFEIHINTQNSNAFDLFLTDTFSEVNSMTEQEDYKKDAMELAEYIGAGDIVVLDGYHFDTAYQKIIKETGCKLVCIDDLHAWHQLADVIINHAEGVQKKDYSAEADTKFCLGLDYVLLRPEFLTSKKNTRKITSVKKVFISMGAADIGNITHKFTKALVDVKGLEEIHLMLGEINPHIESIDKLIKENKHIKIVKHFNISAKKLVELLRKCDVSICPASSISLESSAVGIGLISGFTAENQKGILKGLENRKSAINFGDLNKITTSKIKQKFEEITANPKHLNELIKNQHKMIDGKSPKRILKVFKDLYASRKNVGLNFRFANQRDVDLYYKWANDEEVRSNSYNQEPILYNNHVKWFKTKLKSADCFFYLFRTEKNVPIGQVRIDKSGDEIVIGISIDEKYRGLSLSEKMLVVSCEDYLKKHPKNIITAYIKTKNIASLKAFVKAGFSTIKIVKENGVESYKLTRKRD